MAKITPYRQDALASSQVGTAGVDQTGNMIANAALQGIDSFTHNRTALNATAIEANQSTNNALQSAANRMNADTSDFVEKNNSDLYHYTEKINQNINENNNRARANMQQIQDTNSAFVAHGINQAAGAIGQYFQGQAQDAAEVQRQTMAAVRRQQVENAAIEKQKQNNIDRGAARKAFGDYQRQYMDAGAEASLAIPNDERKPDAYAKDWLANDTTNYKKYSDGLSLNDNARQIFDDMHTEAIEGYYRPLLKTGHDKVTDARFQDTQAALQTAVARSGSVASPDGQPSYSPAALNYTINGQGGVRSLMSNTVDAYGKKLAPMEIEKGVKAAGLNWIDKNMSLDFGDPKANAAHLDALAKMMHAPDGSIPFQQMVPLFDAGDASKVLRDITAKQASFQSQATILQQKQDQVLRGSIEQTLAPLAFSPSDAALVEPARKQLQNIQAQLQQEVQNTHSPSSISGLTLVNSALNQVQSHLDRLNDQSDKYNRAWLAADDKQKRELENQAKADAKAEEQRRADIYASSSGGVGPDQGVEYRNNIQTWMKEYQDKVKGIKGTPADLAEANKQHAYIIEASNKGYLTPTQFNNALNVSSQNYDRISKATGDLQKWSGNWLNWNEKAPVYPGVKESADAMRSHMTAGAMDLTHQTVNPSNHPAVKDSIDTYTNRRRTELYKTFTDTHPGVDPATAVDSKGRKYKDLVDSRVNAEVLRNPAFHTAKAKPVAAKNGFVPPPPAVPIMSDEQIKFEYNRRFGGG